MSGIYIHIPFCASRCIYCDFYSTVGIEDMKDTYIDCIIEEHNIRNDYLEGDTIETLYIGGGTPSQLSIQNIQKISSHFKYDYKEFTIECNPDDITHELANALNDCGVTRVSMGVQTFNDERLKFLNRRHSSKQILEAVDTLRKSGINNISIDLMFGFPGETAEEWQNDMKEAIKLNVEHISAYSLMYEEGTRLHKMLERGDIKENPEELSSELYEMLLDTMSSYGYEQYEISNFSKPGYHSLHNSNYWNGTKYLGLGAAAHSYNGKERQWNISNIKEYIHSINQGIVPMEYEQLDDDTRYNDTITTALRTRTGIDLGSLDEEYYNYIIKSAKKSIEAGLLLIENNHIRLTRNGLYVSDNFMSDLIKV